MKRLEWPFEMNSAVQSKAVLIYFTLPGNVYIPEHDLFSDTAVSWKQRGCLSYIKQGRKAELRYYQHPAPIGW